MQTETIRALVKAYARGEITLPPLPAKTSKNQIRYAPSFIQGDPSVTSQTDIKSLESLRKYPYSARQWAEFLGERKAEHGWNETGVTIALYSPATSWSTSRP